jgi:cell division septal protein FtsQ
MKSQKWSRKKGRRFEAAGALVGRRPLAVSHSALRWLRNGLFVLLVAVAAGAVWLWLDDRFYVFHADVVGTARLSPEEVFQASGLRGLHILWARPAEIEAHLMATFPTIESVEVACGLPAACAISVVERQPRMVWDDGGQLWWIDAHGFIFAAADARSEGWTVQGPLPRDEDERLTEDVRVALVELWASGVEVAQTLRYVPGRGLVLTDEHSWRIILGQGAGVAGRLQVAKWLAADLRTRGLTPRFIDVRFAGAPYYSLTNEW